MRRYRKQFRDKMKPIHRKHGVKAWRAKNGRTTRDGRDVQRQHQQQQQQPDEKGPGPSEPSTKKIANPVCELEKIEKRFNREWQELPKIQPKIDLMSGAGEQVGEARPHVFLCTFL